MFFTHFNFWNFSVEYISSIINNLLLGNLLKSLCLSCLGIIWKEFFEFQSPCWSLLSIYWEWNLQVFLNFLNFVNFRNFRNLLNFLNFYSFLNYCIRNKYFQDYFLCCCFCGCFLLNWSFRFLWSLKFGWKNHQIKPFFRKCLNKQLGKSGHEFILNC